MDKKFHELISGLGRKILDYMPDLLGGLMLLLLGWLVAWIVKRIAIQILIILRFDRLLVRLRWKNSLTKADIRYALYNSIGNVLFAIVFLIFLNSALEAMKLTMLSKLIERGVLFIPHLIVALTIFGIGWLIASRTSKAVAHSLIKEGLPGATLLAKLYKFIVIIFFSAMALVEINIAKQIVFIGFGALLLTLSVSVILIVKENQKNFKIFSDQDKKNKP
jgi:hypothetical protein